MRNKVIALRLTENEKKIVEDAAKARHVDTAVYVRQVVLEASKEK